MSEWSYRDATVEDAEALWSSLRPLDVTEWSYWCRIDEIDPYAAYIASISSAIESGSALAFERLGRVVGIGAARPATHDAALGVGFVVASEELFSSPRVVAKHASEILGLLARPFEALLTYTPTWHTARVRWLRRLGFRPLRAVDIPPLYLPHFEMVRVKADEF